MTKTPFYTTIENQIRNDGSKGVLYDHYDNENQALAKFYTICAAAALSDIPYHAAFLLDENGPIMQRVFDRRTEEEDITISE